MKEQKNIVAITIRMPRQLREKLKNEASEKGLSLNELIILKLNPHNRRLEQGVPILTEKKERK